MLPKIFKPDGLYKLIRIGKNNDGGYLVCEKSINSSDILISFGISDDFSFENEFKIKKKVEIYAYDPTVSTKFFFKQFFSSLIKLKLYLLSKQVLNFLKFKSFFNKKGNKLFKKKIGKDGNIFFENLSISDILKTINVNKKIFFKIDIEGSEYRLLDELIQFSQNIQGLVIEFHDVDINLDKINNFLNKFDLKLIHIHGNNWCDYASNNIPASLELSFSRNPIYIQKNLILPHVLDQKNNPDRDEIELFFLDN